MTKAALALALRNWVDDSITAANVRAAVKLLIDHGHTLTVEEVDPSTVLLGKNMRTDPELTDEFIESIRANGVLQPLRAVRTAAGEIKLLFGSRRRAGAIAAGRPLPVYVIGPEDITKQGQVDRLFIQWDENKQRAPISAQDEAAFVQDLLDFKISPTQIKRRAGLDKAAVDRARKVAKSERVMNGLPIEDLEMAAAIAEFDIAGDVEAAEKLTAAIADGPGQFRHTAQRLTDTQDERLQRRDLAAELTAAGIVVLIGGENGDPTTADGTPVDWRWRLLDWKSADGEPLTPENHADCPGHAAYLHRDGMYVDSKYIYTWKPIYVCVDPPANGHEERYGSNSSASSADSDEAKEAAAKQRRLVMDHNKLWRSARTVRQEFLRQLLGRKEVPEGARLIIRGAITGCWLARWDRALSGAISDGHKLACELLGLAEVDAAGKACSAAEAIAVAMRGASEDRQDVMALGMVLASWEAALGDETWRRYVKELNQGYRDGNSTTVEGAFLLLLEGWGYCLSDIERLVVAAVQGAAATAAEADDEADGSEAGDDEIDEDLAGDDPE